MAHTPTQPSAKRVYLDYAAATPLHPEVLAAMMPYFTSHYGNPSAIHTEGRIAREAVESARGEVAGVLGIRKSGVFFTSGGTEANNLALLGYVRSLHAAGRPYSDMEVLTTTIEHPATSRALDEAATWGVRVRHIPLTETGRCTAEALRATLSPHTVLVSIAHVNSEIGTIQPSMALARTLRTYGAAHDRQIRLHIDAAQSPLWLSVRLDALGADMLTLDAGKCGGPKGSGILAVARPDIITQPISFGGGQEFGVRPGTEAVAQIVGAATALAFAQAAYSARADTVSTVRDAAWDYATATLPGVQLNGPLGEERVANNINVSIPGYDTEFAATVLDTHGFSVSTKSACSSSDSAASSVVYAISGDTARARATLRLTLGPDTPLEAVRRCLDVLAAHMQQMAPYRDSAH